MGKQSCDIEIVTTVAIPAAMCLNPHRALPLHQGVPSLGEVGPPESVGNRSCCRFSARHLPPGQCFLVRFKMVKEQVHFQGWAGSGELRPDPCEAAVWEDTHRQTQRHLPETPRATLMSARPQGPQSQSEECAVGALEGTPCKERRRWLRCWQSRAQGQFTETPTGLRLTPGEISYGSAFLSNEPRSCLRPFQVRTQNQDGNYSTL